jgi:hypothetical protein
MCIDAQRDHRVVRLEAPAWALLAAAAVASRATAAGSPTFENAFMIYQPSVAKALVEV